MVVLLACPTYKSQNNSSSSRRCFLHNRRNLKQYPRPTSIKRCSALEKAVQGEQQEKIDSKQQFEKGETRDNKRIEFILLGLKDLEDWESKVLKIKDDFSPRNVAVAVRMLERLSQSGRSNYPISPQQSYLLEELLQSVRANIDDYSPDGVSFLVLSLARMGYSQENSQVWGQLGNVIKIYADQGELEFPVLARITQALSQLSLKCQIFKAGGGQLLDSIETCAINLFIKQEPDNSAVRLLGNLLKMSEKFDRNSDYVQNILQNLKESSFQELESQDVKNLIVSLKNYRNGELLTGDLLFLIVQSLDSWFEKNQKRIITLYCGTSKESDKQVIDWMNSIENLIQLYDHQILHQILGKLLTLCSSQEQIKFALPKVMMKFFFESKQQQAWSKNVLEFSLLQIYKLRIIKTEVRVEVFKCVNKAVQQDLLQSGKLAQDMKSVEGALSQSDLTYGESQLDEIAAHLLVRLVSEMEEAAKNAAFVRQHTGNLLELLQLLKNSSIIPKQRVVSIYESLLDTICEFGKENMFSVLKQLCRKGFPPNTSITNQLQSMLEVCSLRDCVLILDLCRGWRFAENHELFVNAYVLAQQLMSQSQTDLKGACALMAYLWQEGIQDNDMQSLAIQRIQKDIIQLEEDDLTALLVSAGRIRQVPVDLRPFMEMLVNEAHEKCVRIQDRGLMKPHNLASIAWSTAMIGFRGSKFFGSSINQLIAQLSVTKVSDLAMWCNACSKVKYTPPIAPLDTLNTHIIAKAKQLNPTDIERIMHFYAASGQEYFHLLHTGQNLIQCIAQATTQQFNQFSLQQISSVMNAFPVLRFNPGGRLMGKTTQLVNTIMTPGSEYQDSVMRVTFLLWAIAYFGFGEVAVDTTLFFDHSLQFLIENGSKGLRPQDVVEFMLFFGWSGQLTPRRFKLFGEVLEKFQVDLFQQHQLADIFRCSLMVVIPAQTDNNTNEKMSALPAPFQSACWDAWHNVEIQIPIQVQQISEELTKMSVTHSVGTWCANDLVNVDILLPKINLVILFEDVEQYSCNLVKDASPIALGPTLGRRRMIQNLDFNVMAIPWFHWQQLFTSEDQIRYLNQVLQVSQKQQVNVLPNNFQQTLFGGSMDQQL